MKIKVKVIPCSSKLLIEEDSSGNLRIKLKSAPVKGRANQELIGLLSKYFKISKSQVKIIKGLASKNKVIEIDD